LLNVFPLSTLLAAMVVQYPPEKLAPLIIHGKWYDMSGYNHPGGPIMIRLGAGRDATAMFESHHPFTSRKQLEQLLEKHLVDNPTDPSSGCQLLDKRDQEQMFEWPEPQDKKTDQPQRPISAFGQELQTRVRDYFAAEAKRRGVSLIQATKATPAKWAQLAFLFAMTLATLPFFFAGQYWTLLGTPLVYWLFGVNCFHDASHFALSRDWRINAMGTYTGIWFSSPLAWYHQHVIGHHAYPNIPHRDPDLYHNGTFERHTNTLRHRPMHMHQHMTWVPIWLIGTFAMNFFKPMQMFATGYYNRAVAVVRFSKRRIYDHFVGRVLVFALCHLWSFVLLDSWIDAFLFSVIPVMVVSVCFMICSQVNHLSEENIDVRDHCFYAHQVKTSHSFGGTTWLRSCWAYLFSGGLNLQIEHHLFPTVNHCHLPQISAMVKELCKKHGVYYHESTGFRQAFGKYLKHMKELSVAEIIAEHTSDHHHTTQAEHRAQPHRLQRRECSGRTTKTD